MRQGTRRVLKVELALIYDQVILQVKHCLHLGVDENTLQNESWFQWLSQ